MAPVGSVPRRARLGDGARGLLGRRGRLAVLPVRPRPLARLPLERGRHRGALRHPAGHLPGGRPVERSRSAPEGALLRARRTSGQSRRGCQGVLVVPRRVPVALLAVHALPLPAGCLPVRAADRGERVPRSQPAGVRADGHGHLRRRPLLEGRRRLRQGVADRHLHAHPRHEHGARTPTPSTSCRRCGSATTGTGAASTSARIVEYDEGTIVAEHWRAGRYHLEAAPLADGTRPDTGVLRQRDQHGAALRRLGGAGVALPEGRDQRPRRQRRRHREPRPARDEGGLVVPADGRGRRDGGASPAVVEARARRASRAPTGRGRRSTS